MDQCHVPPTEKGSLATDTEAPGNRFSPSRSDVNHQSSRSEKDGEYGLRHVSGSLLVTEQARPLDDRELSVWERPRHLFRPCDRKESIARSPDELYRDVDAPVQLGELADVPEVEAAKHLDGGCSMVG